MAASRPTSSAGPLTSRRWLRSSVREIDTLGRYGGEEFLIVLPRTDKAGGLVVAEKIRQEVEASSFPREENQPGGRITVSIGLSVYPTDGEDSSILIDKADLSLTRAKNLGCNRVES